MLKLPLDRDITLICNHVYNIYNNYDLPASIMVSHRINQNNYFSFRNTKNRNNHIHVRSRWLPSFEIFPSYKNIIMKLCDILIGF